MFITANAQYLGMGSRICHHDMEEALDKIDAQLLLLDQDSGQQLLSIGSDKLQNVNPLHTGSNFLSLNRLAHNLKLGPLNQVVAITPDHAEFSNRHSERTVAITAAKRLDQAIVADSLVDQLLN